MSPTLAESVICFSENSIDPAETISRWSISASCSADVETGLSRVLSSEVGALEPESAFHIDRAKLGLVACSSDRSFTEDEDIPVDYQNSDGEKRKTVKFLK